MRVDAHHHLWHYSSADYGWISDEMSAIRKDYLPNDLIKELDHSRIDGTVVVQARQTVAETRWLLSLAAEEPAIKGVVGWIDLAASDLNEQLAEY
ncbi:MAG: amidohydrolase, partial [Natronospirillum sp.]